MRIYIILLLIALSSLPTGSLAQDSPFTYQGRLTDRGVPANGNYDLRFTLHDAAVSGSRIAAAVTNAAVSVRDGLFNVGLDFGAEAFTGSPRWLEVGARTNGASTEFVTLSPRQPITPTPYAITALQLNGMLPDSQLSPNIPRLNQDLKFSGLVTLGRDQLAPFAVGNSVKVENLNADLFDGLDSSAFLLKSECCLPTIADLKSKPPGFVPCVTVLGYHRPGDGGGGMFFWEPLATVNLSSYPSGEDGGIQFKPHSIPPLQPGRWRRLFTGSISVAWFGANGEDRLDDTVSIQAALSYMQNAGEVDPLAKKVPVLEFSPGSFTITNGLALMGQYFRIEGNKAKITATHHMTAMLTIGDALPGHVDEEVEIRSLLLYANSQADHGVWIREGQNHSYRDLSVYSPNVSGYFVDGAGNGGGIRVLNIEFANCLCSGTSSYGFYFNKATNHGSFESFLLTSCGVEGGTDLIRCVGAFGMEIVGGTFQKASNAGLYVDAARVSVRGGYFENFGQPSLVVTNGALVSGSKASWGSGILYGDTNSIVWLRDFTYGNGQGYNRTDSRTGKIADRDGWGSPIWPIGLGGSVNPKGSKFTDQYGTEWLCTTGGTSSGSRFVPLNGQFVIPIDHTDCLNGKLLWFANEDFVVSEILFVVTTKFDGNPNFHLAFGTSGTVQEGWISYGQGNAGNLNSAVVINAAANSSSMNLLGGTRKAFLPGVGGDQSAAGASSIRLFCSNPANLTSGAGFLLVKGYNLKFD